MAVDARFLTGSDGSAVTTWPNRGSSSYDMTQSTPGFRPVLRVGSNGINGAQAVQFDGTDDLLQGASDSLDSSTVLCTYIMPPGGDLEARTLFNKGSSTLSPRQVLLYSLIVSGVGRMDSQRSDGTSFPTAIFNSVQISAPQVAVATSSSASVTVSVRGAPDVSETSVSATSDKEWSIGATFQNSGKDFFFIGNIGSVAVWKSVLSDSSAIRKRCTHAAAYSFKVPCS
jgi:hypothetical protein